MHKLTMYCFCLHDKLLPLIKKMGYLPVGLGQGNFSKEWLRDSTLENISFKNNYYSEYTFYYWFWKNVLPKIEDNQWIGFCAYRDLWCKKKNVIGDPNFIINTQRVPCALLNKNTKLEDLTLSEIPNEWEKFDTVIGQHMYFDSLKFSKLIKHGITSLIRNPSAIFKSKRNIRFQFDMFHGDGNLDKAIDLLDDSDREDFRKYTRQNISFSRGNIFICRSKKIINAYFSSVFSWLEKCEKIFGFNLEGYGNIRIYAFLAERYHSYWFEKYTKPLLWPVFFYDTAKINVNN